MNKFICTICGFIYDESLGYPDGNISPATKWSDLPSQWKCPWCGASKAAFKEDETNTSSTESRSTNIFDLPSDLDYSSAELSAIFSNLSKGCEKQYLAEESRLYLELSHYFAKQSKETESASLHKLEELLQNDLDILFKECNQVAKTLNDRGSLRALKWAEQVTRMLQSHLESYSMPSTDKLKDQNIYVCEICGFIYIGDEKPKVCPICKVPNNKITQIQRGA